MNDFLQSLRNNKEKQQHYNQRGNNRRDINAQYNGNPNNHHYDRRNGNDKRPHHNHKPYNNNHNAHQHNMGDVNADLMNDIKALLEEVTLNQKRLITVAEMRALSEERKAEAIEGLAEWAKQMMRMLTEKANAPAAPVEAADSRTHFVNHPSFQGASAITDGDSEREKIMRIIHEMRSEGATYDQIAETLTEKGFATFSGRGQWHAQTIHRLCQKLK
ncbi:MAG: hypothetical protein CSA22_01355 [Deltaproteobacteria bacterium]|nr:MAG: hypothetical protein CSA22_01355 [Deltaproteobacteria bacterium]